MDRAQPGQRRCQYGVRGAPPPPLRANKLPKIGKKRERIRKNREKERKIRKKNREKEEISGRKGRNRESFFTLPLLTDINAGYATEPGSAGAGPGVPEMARKIEEIIKNVSVDGIFRGRGKKRE